MQGAGRLGWGFAAIPGALCFWHDAAARELYCLDLTAVRSLRRLLERPRPPCADGAFLHLRLLVLR